MSVVSSNNRESCTFFQQLQEDGDGCLQEVGVVLRADYGLCERDSHQRCAFNRTHRAKSHTSRFSLTSWAAFSFMSSPGDRKRRSIAVSVIKKL